MPAPVAPCEKAPMGSVREKPKGLQLKRPQALKARGSDKMKKKRLVSREDKLSGRHHNRTSGSELGLRKAPSVSLLNRAVASELGLEAMQEPRRENGKLKRMMRDSKAEYEEQEEREEGEQQEELRVDYEEQEEEREEGEEEVGLRVGEEGEGGEGEESNEEEVEQGEGEEGAEEDGEEEDEEEGSREGEEEGSGEGEGEGVGKVGEGSNSGSNRGRATEARLDTDPREPDSNDGEEDRDPSGSLGQLSREGTAVDIRGSASKKKAAPVLVPGKKKHHKTGVCYLSRIPPHMKPLKLRHLLSRYAAIGRIYLAPEDPAIRQRRKQAGGNTGKNFTEGWVEFERKRDAKQIAEMLNGEPMGGGHRSAYRWDLWNIKYLHGFKWDNLTEEIAYRNAVREQKLATELRAAAKERDFYLQQVNKSKGLKAMEEKRKKRGQVDTKAEEFAKIRRTFVQRDAVKDAGAQATPLLSKDVLSKVFN